MPKYLYIFLLRVREKYLSAKGVPNPKSLGTADLDKGDPYELADGDP